LPFILLSVLFVVSLASTSIFLIRLSSSIDIQSQKLVSQDAEIAKAATKQVELEGKLQDSVSQFEDIKQLSALSLLQHDMEGGIVTDDFVVNKISLYPKDNAYFINIDLTNQPAMYASYKGKGAYTITDRELRTKGTEITDKVKDYYNKNKLDKMPAWDKNTVSLTIQNYNIGEFKNGELVLAGEIK
jgi:hypothetical protein